MPGRASHGPHSTGLAAYWRAFPLPINFRAWLSCPGVRLGLLPNFTPRRCAAFTPARVRSEMRLLSSSTNTPIICHMARPVGGRNQRDRSAGVKRRELVRRLERAACVLKRSGSRPVPRRTEMPDSLCGPIWRQLGVRTEAPGRDQPDQVAAALAGSDGGARINRIAHGGASAPPWSRAPSSYIRTRRPPRPPQAKELSESTSAERTLRTIPPRLRGGIPCLFLLPLQKLLCPAGH